MNSRESFLSGLGGIVGTVSASALLNAGSVAISILCGLCTLILTAPPALAKIQAWRNKK